MPFDVSGRAPETRTGDRDRHLVAGWLFAIAGMILLMIALGGATRLTGSGLSIMEWAPLSGTLPPLSHAEWDRLFALYREIPQYRLVNPAFGLADFQHIFWLEWIHRLFGRLIGLAFLLPAAWFWLTGRLDRRMLARLAAIFLLGGLQGAVGWFMVASGFFADSTAVSAYRLVVHLALALTLFAAVLWTGLDLAGGHPIAAPRLLRIGAGSTACLVAVTIVAGGFVAGIHAGLDYNSFPLMDGQWVPSGYAALHPFLRNLTENVASVQFDHRLLATLTAAVALATLCAGLRSAAARGLRARLAALGCAVVLQYGLGVATLLAVVPIDLAVAHQVGATLLLTASLVLLHPLRVPRAL
jgi:cytochrome c oxidase assembly protein subunit 15